MWLFCLPALADLPVPVRSPNVQVSSPKADKKIYAPGEAAQIEVKFKNKSELDIEAIVILDVALPDGMNNRIRSEIRFIPAGATENTKLKYAIPADAPAGRYFARVFLRNPYVREPFYSDDAVQVFEVKGVAKGQAKIEEKYIAAGNWPGAVLAPSEPVSQLPFAPKKRMVSNTLTPEFFWPAHPAAVSYKMYISSAPFSPDNIFLSEGVTALKYTFDPSDASIPLVQGRAYEFTVLPKDSQGNTLVGKLDGFFTTFIVDIRPPAPGSAAGETGAAGVSDVKRDDLRAVLNGLKDAFVSSDRRALMALIHPDWISADTTMIDYSTMDNAIRDLFTKIATSYVTWSSDNIDEIVSPNRVTLSFKWLQKMYHSTYNRSLDVNVTVRFDLRRVNNKWLIYQDLDNKIFKFGFGFTAPASSNLFGDLPPGAGR